MLPYYIPYCAETGGPSTNELDPKLTNLTELNRVAPGWGAGITYETRPQDVMSG